MIIRAMNFFIIIMFQKLSKFSSFNSPHSIIVKYGSSLELFLSEKIED